METDQAPTEIVVAILLLDLMLLRAAREACVTDVVDQLKSHGYSLRRIARATGIPRTTLGRWNQGATA